MHISTGTWEYPSHTAADNRQVHQIARADLSSAFVDSFVLVVDRKRPFVARRRSIESLCDCLQKKKREQNKRQIMKICEGDFILPCKNIFSSNKLE